MDTIKEDSLQPTVIDLHAAKRGKVEESFLRMFGGAVQGILGRMFGGPSMPVTIKGTKSEVESFAKAIDGEKRYMRAYQRYGLNDPRTYKNRYALDAAIKDFERETMLKWPFK